MKRVGNNLNQITRKINSGDCKSYNFEKAFLDNFDKADAKEISRMKKAWKNIDNGYAEHIRAKFPEINLNQL